MFNTWFWWGLLGLLQNQIPSRNGSLSLEQHGKEQSWIICGSLTSLLRSWLGIFSYSVFIFTPIGCSYNIILNICSWCRGLGPWGPGLVNRYTSARFGAHSVGTVLTDEESRLLTGEYFLLLEFHRSIWMIWWRIADKWWSVLVVDYVYHTLAAKASGELCLKYIFSFGAFARKPLLQRFVHQNVKNSFL